MVYGATVLTNEVPTEHLEQREFVKWFRQTFVGVRIFAIPNGGARSTITASRLKVEGVSAGVPDLYVPAWRLWIEMKRTKGSSIDKNQKDWHQYLTSLGDMVIIGYGSDGAKNLVLEIAQTKPNQERSSDKTPRT
jgi:hypothetical protein